MIQTIYLKVMSSLLAVDTIKSGFVPISVGSIIETTDDLQEPGLHRVRYRDQPLFAFTRDIQERTERVRATAAS